MNFSLKEEKDAENGEIIDLNQVYWQRTIADRIKLKIDDWFIEQAEDGYRTHLGWSVIGHPCLRYLYYHWRWMWPEKHSARTERIFLNGNDTEKNLRVILSNSGAIFLDDVNVSGEQIKVSSFGGHFGGSVDGIFIWPAVGLFLPTLLETKSSKTGAPFNDLVKKGVMESKPQHFVQQSGYGNKLNIEYACYITYNKNDSDIFVEIVDLDSNLAEEHERKALFVITTNQLPRRISEKSNFYICNMCSVKHGCHDRMPPIPNCRNCRHSAANDSGNWHCNHWSCDIPGEDEILKGCTNHSLMDW